MSLETILINADSEQHLPRLIDVTERVAIRDHSHVVGLAALPSPVTLPAGMPGTPDIVTYEAHRSSARAAAERTGALFRQMTAGKLFTSEWRLDDGVNRGEIDALVAQSRLADLIVTSNVRAAGRNLVSHATTERLIIDVGRPVLLVPQVATPSAGSRRVLIGWNGSREATRAVFDALPLLRSAQHVKVMQIGGNAADPVSGLGGVALCGMLRRHGVRATAETLDLPRASAGAALLSALKAENAELLVMGGYGHWRFRELVLGGATRHVIKHMSTPVLMSH